VVLGALAQGQFSCLKSVLVYIKYLLPYNHNRFQLSEPCDSTEETIASIRGYPYPETGSTKTALPYSSTEVNIDVNAPSGDPERWMTFIFEAFVGKAATTVHQYYKNSTDFNGFPHDH
jgi:hypothetical protein